MAKTKLDLIFEISWEVCNKVGGIYTVLSSRSKILNTSYPDRVIFIGPDFENRDDNPLFLCDDSLQYMTDDLQLPFNIKVRTGRWNIPGQPLVFLIDFKGVFAHLNEYYGEMWNNFRVDSLHAYGDYDESCAFSLASAIVIGAYYNAHRSELDRIVAHFNEWTTGMGLLYLSLHYPTISTVFTTHATSIGRSICGNNKPLYGYFEGYNGDQMAVELNMQSKHSLEKAAAHYADCFTAVSDITARESGQLLEKYPDVVTPNGFEKAISKTPSHRSKLRKTERKRILEVAKALTGTDYPEDTFIIATSGRNEYRNKGLDLFLDSMAVLRTECPQRKVLALILVPAWIKCPRPDLAAALCGNKVNRLPEPFITHELNNHDEDTVLRRIRELGFGTCDNSNVDVIYIPCYLDGKDGILDINYYDLLPALDLTVFPSYYEPWGYTPLESIAFGVPTVTTSLSGFGQWIESTFPQKDILKTGVAVIKRDDFNYQEVVSSIVRVCGEVMALTAPDYQTVRDNAVATSNNAQWSTFIKYYYDAYTTALTKNKKKQNKK